jgi:ABC-type uncharacterized transport system auxiliary subunit
MTGGGKPGGLTYTLSALPASAEGAKPLEKQIAVPDPSALLTYDSDRVLTQTDGKDLASLGNAKWADSLTKLVQSRIVQSFENTGSLKEVSRPIEGGAPEFQLATEIRKFQIVPGPEMTAEAQISAKIISADGHIVAARIFDGSAPVKSAEEASTAKALGKFFSDLIPWTAATAEETGAANALDEAFGKILSNLIPWTADVIAGGGEKPSPAPAQPKRRGQARG